MKPRHSATAVLALFAAVLVAWMLVRSHVTAPAGRLPGNPAGGNPAIGTSSPLAFPTVRPSLAGAAPETAPTVASSQDSVAAKVSPPRSPGPVSPAAQIVPTPAAVDGDVARSDAAMLNAIKVRRMMTDYHTLNGENPVGTNAEIMAAIMGKNSRQAILGPPEGLSLNGNGELVDDWGTPYFFHQLSKDVMEIHSAGPDKIMGTSDDIVVR